MASPRHLPAATPGNKENIPDGGAATISDCPELCKEGAFSPKPKKKPTGFNLRKSIAWNPAFFTEQGVLDNSELSMLTGSQLKANGSPRSGAMSPFCRSGRSASACVLKGVAENSHGKLSAKHCSAEKQGRKLFSSAKTPQRDQRRESAESQNRSSSRSIKKCIPRVPSGSIQKKVPNSSSTAQMSGIPKKSQPCLPTVPRTTSPLTTVLKSNIKLGPVKAEQVHRVPGLPPKSKISSVSSGSRTVKDVVPAVTPTHEEANGSLKCKNFLPHPQISPSSSFGGPASTFAKPSALRMPSPSVGFFTQENAHASHANAAKRNVGSCFVGNTSSVIKPPRYKQPEDLKSGVHLTKPLSTNCIAASNPLVLPVIGKSSPNALVGNTSSVIKPPRYKQPEDLKSGVHLTKPVSTNCIAASNPLVLPVIGKSSPNALVAPDKESSSKNITCSAKSVNANNQEIPDASCLLAGNGATIQPPILAKNDAARNSLPDVYSDTPHIERRNPFENSYPLKAVCPSTIEPVEDTSLEFTCSSTKPSAGGTLLPSSISSQECSSSDLTYQSKPESSSSEAIYLSNSHVAETTLAISLSEGESCTPALDFLQGFDSHDHQNTECATLMESVESIICADQAPCFGSSKGETPTLADCHSDFGDSLCNENKPASSEEVNTVGGVELEINNGSSVKETPSLHVVCQNNHNYRRTEPSPMILEAPMLCAESQDALSVEPNMEDKMVLDTDKLSAVEGASRIVNIKAPDRSWTNGNLKDQLKDLVPFTEEWLAVMEARGQEVLEQKTGAVQNSPPDKTAPEPSPWSPVKRKAQDVGPFDCTKYSKSVRTCGTP